MESGTESSNVAFTIAFLQKLVDGKNREIGLDFVG